MNFKLNTKIIALGVVFSASSLVAGAGLYFQVENLTGESINVSFPDTAGNPPASPPYCILTPTGPMSFTIENGQTSAWYPVESNTRLGSGCGLKSSNFNLDFSYPSIAYQNNISFSQQVGSNWFPSGWFPKRPDFENFTISSDNSQCSSTSNCVGFKIQVNAPSGSRFARKVEASRAGINSANFERIKKIK